MSNIITILCSQCNLLHKVENEIGAIDVVVGVWLFTPINIQPIVTFYLYQMKVLTRHQAVLIER
jgi:hypothetical protein